MKQLIIARKDLNMSPGKLAAQCCHASMAFLTRWLQKNDNFGWIEGKFDEDIMDEWINDIFTKIICGAKNRSQLMKAVAIAEELGLRENEDFFLIKDVCLTELEPEETDENGVGRVLTCIGFKPMADDVVSKISKKYQLYK